MSANLIQLNCLEEGPDVRNSPIIFDQMLKVKVLHYLTTVVEQTPKASNELLQALTKLASLRTINASPGYLLQCTGGQK